MTQSPQPPLRVWIATGHPARRSLARTLFITLATLAGVGIAFFLLAFALIAVLIGAALFVAIMLLLRVVWIVRRITRPRPDSPADAGRVNVRVIPRDPND